LALENVNSQHEEETAVCYNNNNNNFINNSVFNLFNLIIIIISVNYTDRGVQMGAKSIGVDFRRCICIQFVRNEAESGFQDKDCIMQKCGLSLRVRQKRITFFFIISLALNGGHNNIVMYSFTEMKLKKGHFH
jgi:hypothetical protein